MITDEFNHITPIELRFNDFDMLGHVNNSIYLQMMDLAKVKYFEQVTGRTVTDDSVCPIIAHIEIDFDAPTLPGEKLSVVTRTEKIGTKSLTLLQCIFNPETNAIKTRAKVVMVNYDRENAVTVDISDSDRKAIAAFEHREL